jgi:hypothetical protein
MSNVSEDYLTAVGQAIRGMLPGASWEQDNDGQLVIYTNVWQVGSDEYIERD